MNRPACQARVCGSKLRQITSERKPEIVCSFELSLESMQFLLVYLVSLAFKLGNNLSP
jgi:hypothetical protein